MAGYFQGRLNELTLCVKSSEEDIGLRECQIGAYWATKGHFTAYDDPALISLPTGAGKTALMMLLALGLEAHRVLVVSPSDVLRTQTYEKFKSLDGLVQAGVVDVNYEKPEVHKQTARISGADVWHELEPYDVVVALPNNISTEYNREDLEDIVPPPDGFFDLVFFDEAHHMRAPSWHRLLRDFQGAKRVLLTATPFRRDRRKIPGRLVYFYPLHRAMDTGIYHPVKFHPVDAVSDEEREGTLCSEAVDVLTSLRTKEQSIKMLIRTDRIEKALGLERLYTGEGVRVEAVHSQRTPRQNEETLNRLRNGELDGVIAVGKLGEGLDIVNLKVAVFHEPPKSFPFTVQLVGRIARPVETEGLEACVIADPRQLREKGVADEVRRLYQEDQAWRDLIPELVEEFAGRVVRDITPGSSEILVGVDYEDLAPYLSARLYRINGHQINLDADLWLGEEYAVYPLSSLGDTHFLGIITETVDKPIWAKKTALEVPVFDLHLYYYHERSRTLFECTTSNAVASQIRSLIIKEGYDRLGGEELVRVMHSEQNMDYLVAGLANALGPSGALPSYKMFLGNEVQGAVNPSDARVFIRGHVVARMIDGETRGISDSQGRVWSMQRANIHEFISWCDRIGDALVENEKVEAAKGLEFIGSPKRQKRFPSKPIQIVMHPKTLLYEVLLQKVESGQTEFADLDSPYFEVGEFATEDHQTLEVNFIPGADTDGLKLAYNIEKNRWETLSPGQYIFKVDDGYSSETLELGEFFDEYAPYFYLSDGAVVIGGRMQKVRFAYEQLPSECLVEGLDWSACDITH